MKTNTLLAVVVALLLLPSNETQSQDAPPSYAHLKPIESLVGVWKSRFDPPGNVPEGDLEVHFRWLGNKSYLQSIVYFHPDGIPVEAQLSPEFMIVGYDTGAAAIKTWHFEYTNQRQMDAKIETNRLVIYPREEKAADANHQRPIKTYELESPDMLIITELGKSADALGSNLPPLRLKRSSNS